MVCLLAKLPVSTFCKKRTQVCSFPSNRSRGCKQGYGYPKMTWECISEIVKTKREREMVNIENLIVIGRKAAENTRTCLKSYV